MAIVGEVIPVEIARRFARRRLDLGFTRAELSARASVAPATLKRFERSGEIALSRLVRLAVALGLDSALETAFVVPPPTTLAEVAGRVQARPRQRGRRTR